MTPAKRKAKERDGKRSEGLVRIRYPETWVHPHQVQPLKDAQAKAVKELNEES